MGASRFADIPGNRQTFSFAVASAASAATGTTGGVYIPSAGIIRSVNYVLQASQAAATVARSFQLINLSTDGTGTVIAASVAVPTASAVANGFLNFPVVAAASTVIASTVLGHKVASSTENVTHPAMTAVIEIEYT